MKQDYKERNKERNTQTERSSNTGILDTLFPMESVNLMISNAKSRDVGGTAVAIESVMIDIPVPRTHILNSSSETLVAPMIQKIINNYAYSRGQTTTLVAADVIDYIQEAFNVTGLLYHMWRSQNCKNLSDSRGLDVSDIYKGRIPQLSVDVAEAIRTGLTGGFTAPVYDGDVVISNADWSQDYLTEIPKFKMPESWQRMALALFTGFYRLELGDGFERYYKFYPYALAISGDPLATAWTTAVANLNASILAFPELEDILEVLGFSVDITSSFDFSRDLKGQTALVYYDDSLLLSLVNSGIGCGGNTDTDASALLYIPLSGSSFDYKSSTEISASQLYQLRWLKGLSPVNVLQAQYSDGSFLYLNFIPNNVVIIPEVATIPTMTKAQVDAMNYMTVYGEIAMGFKPPWIALYGLRETPGPVWEFSSSNVTSDVSESGSVWVIPYNDWEAYVIEYQASFIFNGVPWRTQLQAIADSFKSTSILKGQ